jgi:DNA-binding HxlR family transcriptional regulator
MESKRISTSQCPVARSLERVGEGWSILILRDAFYGLTRFDEFQKSLEIAPNMLTRRLNSLVAEGLLERHQYCDKPPRDEYRLTEKGRDFRPVLLALLAWGNKHFAPEGASVVLVNVKTGKPVEPTLVDSQTGKRLTANDYQLAAGPAAGERTRQRIAFAAAKKLRPDLKPEFSRERKARRGAAS